MTNEEIIKKFREKFLTGDPFVNYKHIPELESFLLSSLTEAQEEAHNKGEAYGRRMATEWAKESWIPEALSSYKSELMEKVGKMEEDGASEFDLGSEFSTPRDIRRSGWNKAVAQVQKLIQENG